MKRVVCTTHFFLRGVWLITVVLSGATMACGDQKDQTKTAAVSNGSGTDSSLASGTAASPPVADSPKAVAVAAGTGAAAPAAPAPVFSTPPAAQISQPDVATSLAGVQAIPSRRLLVLAILLSL